MFAKNVLDLADIIKQEQNVHPKKQVIIRNTLPAHTDYSPSRPGEAKSQECWQHNPNSHFGNYYMKEIAKLSGFKYLDSAAIYMDRGDLHLETNHGYDCLNYCYTPETYIPEVVLINKLLR